MKSIALINPPSPFLIEERVAYNSGIMRVGTALKADGHDVEILDFAGDKNYMKTLLDIKRYDIFGFSSTTPQFPMVYEMFKVLKKRFPKSQMIIGGAHASAIGSLQIRQLTKANYETLNEFDTVFIGEGENTENIFRKGWINGGIVKNIDDTLIPDRSMMDIASYKFKINGEPATNIQTQRGCPYKCDFCCGRDIPMYNKVRMHSPKRVVKEMDELNKKFGFKHFMFYDDEINVNIKRLKVLCDALKDKPYKHRGFVRTDMIDRFPESIQWMKDAGFVKLCTGIESGSDRILNLINKKTSALMNLRAAKIIKDAGIHFEAFMLFGHPSETRHDIELSKQWLKDAKPDDFDLNLITPYPGSKIYDDAEPSTEFEDYDWEYKGLYFNKPDYSKDATYYKGLDGQSASNIRTRELTNEDLVKLRNDIEKELKQ